MDFTKFSQIVSAPRMQRYLEAVNSDHDKALQIYQLNLQLSRDFFTIISIFELALRNKINDVIIKYTSNNNWLIDAIQKNVSFNLPNGNKLSAIMIMSSKNKNEFFIEKLKETKPNGIIVPNRFKSIGKLKIRRLRTITSSTPEKEVEIEVVLFELSSGQQICQVYTETVCLKRISFLEQSGRQNCLNTAFLIAQKYQELLSSSANATHNKLIAELTFGFWRYLMNLNLMLLKKFYYKHFLFYQQVLV